MTIIENFKTRPKTQAPKPVRRATYYHSVEAIEWLASHSRFMIKPSRSGIIEQLILKAKAEKWQPK